MEGFAESLALQHSAPFTRLQAAGVITVPKGDLTFEVTVPDSVLEWFVVARVAGRDIWQDWADYYPLTSETAASLAADMRADLSNFLSVLVQDTFRVHGERVERLHLGAWCQLSIASAT